MNPSSSMMVSLISMTAILGMEGSAAPGVLEDRNASDGPESTVRVRDVSSDMPRTAQKMRNSMNGTRHPEHPSVQPEKNGAAQPPRVGTRIGAGCVGGSCADGMEAGVEDVGGTNDLAGVDEAETVYGFWFMDDVPDSMNDSEFRFSDIGFVFLFYVGILFFFAYQAELDRKKRYTIR